MTKTGDRKESAEGVPVAGGAEPPVGGARLQLLVRVLLDRETGKPAKKIPNRGIPAYLRP